MTDWMSVDMLWRNAIAAVPVAILVLALCRVLPCRPATRHSLWAVVLLVLLIPPIIPALKIPRIEAAHLKVSEPIADPVPHSPADRREVPPEHRSRTVEQAAGLERTAPAASKPSDHARTPAPVRTRTNTDHAQGTRSPFTPAPTAAVATDPHSLNSDSGLFSVPSHTARESFSIDRASERPSTALPAFEQPAPAASALNLRPENRPSADVPAIHSGQASREADATESNTDAKPAHGGSSHLASIPPAMRVDSSTKTNFARAWNLFVDEASAELGAYFAAAAQVRDAVLSVPSVPPLAWAIGAVAALLLVAARTWKMHRLLKSARPADADLAREVNIAARKLGLKAAPKALLVDARISPMIMCLPAPRLVLPSSLWAELDDDARAAVVFHELAHLRRRDHWVCWAELAATILYWWHPLVWLVRRRLRDEADLSCDAWVTSLMPGKRRGYARALLETHRYLSGNSGSPGTLGLTVMSAGAQKFARRLTMVMTHRVAPVRSMSGMALALSLAAGALVSTPLWACPPEKNCSTPSPAAARVTKAKSGKALTPLIAPTPTVVSTVPLTIATPAQAAVAPSASLGTTAMSVPTPPSPALAPAAPGAPRTAWRALAVPTPAPAPRPAGVSGWIEPGIVAIPAPEAPEPPEAEETFERHMRSRGGDSSLNHAMADMERRLAELNARTHNLASGGGAAAERRAAVAAELQAAGRAGKREAKCAHDGRAALISGLGHAPIAISSNGQPTIITISPDGQTRVYRVNPERFGQLSEQIGEAGKLLEHGTRSWSFPGGQNLFGPADAAKIEREAAAAAKNAMRDYAKAMGDASVYNKLGERYHVQGLEGLAKLKHLAPALERQKALAEQLRSRSHASREQAEAQRQQVEQQKRQAEQMKRQAEQLQRQAEQLQNRAEKMRQKAEELQQKRRQTGAAGGDQAGQLASTVQEFVQRAEQSTREANTLDIQATQLSTQAESIELQVEELESVADELAESADSIMEEIEATLESEEEDAEETADEVIEIAPAAPSADCTGNEESDDSDSEDESDETEAPAAPAQPTVPSV